MDTDIRNILKTWSYSSDEEDLKARKIVGDDGKPKIQMRVELGITQMEFTGKPDGSTPHGFESYLEYYENLAKRKGPDFKLNKENCMILMREGIQYYYRYLSLMKLNEYEGVIRDTSRNLRLFSFVKENAENMSDRWSFEQYRPYVIMIKSQAKALRFLEGISQRI